MAQIPSEQNYIFEESIRSDAAVSESAFQILGGSVNFLLDNQTLLEGKTLKIVEFLSNSVWTVPQDVSLVLLEGCGGGGSAGFHRILFSGNTSRAAEAGFGACLRMTPKTVTPNASVTITIGAGGSGFGTIATNLDQVIFGNTGANTVFDDGTPVVFPGGLGGCRIDEMNYLSGAPSSAQKVENWIELLLNLRQFGRKRLIGETKGCFEGVFKNTRTLTDFTAEGSANGFRGASLVNNSLNTPTGLTSAGTVGFAGSGPYGPSVNGNASANSGAGGSFAQLTSNTMALYSGGSGRLRIAYVSKF